MSQRRFRNLMRVTQQSGSCFLAAGRLGLVCGFRIPVFERFRNCNPPQFGLRLWVVSEKSALKLGHFWHFRQLFLENPLIF
jgi:hypothetical protein